MSTPAIIWLFIAGLALGIALVQHGKPKTGSHSFPANLTGSAISFGLLYWGGFFSRVVA